MVQPVFFTLPAFGSIVPGQGGRLAAIMRGPTVDGVEQPPYALLISANASHEGRLLWKTHGVKLDGAMSFSDGLANTEDMLAAGQCDAALYVRKDPIDGHGDWYLPSVGELQTAGTNVLELFGTPRAAYWTSTGCGDTQAFTCAIDVIRVMPNPNYSPPFYVRPFRRIPLDLLKSKEKGLVLPQEKASDTMPISFLLPPFGTFIAGQGGHLAAILRGPTVNGIQQAPYALLISASHHECASAWGRPVQIQGAGSYTDGLANTQAMLASNCPAATCMRNGMIDGHGDWYLPSRGEIAAAATNVPEMFSKNECYWSSTQEWSERACVYDFTFTNHSEGKAFVGRVRPFRRIPLDLLKI